MNDFNKHYVRKAIKRGRSTLQEIQPSSEPIRNRAIKFDFEIASQCDVNRMRISRLISHHLSKNPKVVLEENETLLGEPFYCQSRNESLQDLLYEDSRDILILTTSTLLKQLEKSPRFSLDCTFDIMIGTKFRSTTFKQLLTITTHFSPENQSRGQKYNQLNVALFLPSKEGNVYRYGF